MIDTNSRTYLDVSGLFTESKQAVGITRVEAELARLCLTYYNTLSFCRFDNQLGDFVGVSREEVIRELSSFGANRKPSSTQHKSSRDRIKQKITNQIRQWLPPKIHNVAKRVGEHAQRLSSPREQPRLNLRQGDKLIWVSIPVKAKKLARLRSAATDKQVRLYFYCHDVIPICFPQYVGTEYALEFKSLFDFLSTSSAGVVFNSNASLIDFKNLYPKASLPMTVVNPAVGDLTLVSGSDISRKVKELTDSDFILYVSTMEPRKNHSLLYRSYILAHENKIELPRLVCLGRKGWLTDDLIYFISKDPRVNQKISLLQQASDAELALLYSKCLLTVYPSFYEGWGMPVSESLSLGKFCITSGCGSLREAASVGCEFISPHDPKQWMARIHFYHSNPDALRERENVIKNQYRRQDWAAFSRGLINFVTEQS